MIKESSNFFEKHVEKIVLGITGLVFFWFFVTRVLFSPVSIEYDNNKFSPADIDSHIEEQTVVLESKMNREAEPKEQPYDPKVDDFTNLLDSAISDIDTSFTLPQPIVSPGDRIGNRKYRIPSVGEVTNVAVEHIRTVAYVPKIEIISEEDYKTQNSEPNDIDLVTVEAKFDISQLYENFNQSFAGEHIKEAWRDPCLARPIFAAVELQRQELLADGSWSNWQVVPRSKIEPRRETFEIIEDINYLPAGGMKVRLLQYDNMEVKIDLLQPPVYQIASAKEEWFPPLLHKKFVEYQGELDVLERREAAAERRGGREDDRPRREIRTSAVASGIGEVAGPGAGRSSSTRRSPIRSRADRQEVREQPQKNRDISQTLEDINKEYEDILLANKTELDKDKPLLFWAHDDTIEPGKSYRYKIRLGVFNPIAGTNQFREQDQSSKNKVILWSKASDVTKVVNVPGTLYFFPRELQETAKAVTVQVSRYILGYWYSKDFTVKQGELIGRVSEYNATEEEESKKVTVPKEVDYSTGAVLVDIIPVNDWSGGSNLHAQHFFDMLYSFDGTSVERLPIKTRYWTDDLQNKFNDIRRLGKEPKEPLKAWTGGRSGIRRPGVGEGVPLYQGIGE